MDDSGPAQADPLELAARGLELSGLDYIHAIFAGELPPPPIAQLMGFRGVEARPGTAVFEMKPGLQHYNPIGSVHGGIALTLLDSAMGCAVHTLLEIRKYCPEVFSKVEVWVDGGIKRGTDVVKALCLGATAVGIGRAPLFGLGAGGQAGVERVLESKWSPLSWQSS